MTASADPIAIRPAVDAADCARIEQLIMQIWQRGPQETVSKTLLTALLHNHSAMLLAYDGDRPIGFCFSFLSLTAERRLKHHSQMTGVLPAYQGRGVGERLKWAQRDVVQRQGIDLITWTFDPLETRNAWLNLHKLGAIAAVYYRDFYGALDDGLNAGLPTDRLEAQWWINSARVTARAAQRETAVENRHWSEVAPQAADAPPINPPDRSGELPRPGAVAAGAFDRPIVLVAAPAAIAQIKRAEPPLALAWRLHLREALEQAFARGYRAVDLLLRPDGPCYVLAGEEVAVGRLGDW